MQKEKRGEHRKRSVAHHAHVGGRFKKNTLLFLVALVLLWLIFIAVGAL